MERFVREQEGLDVATAESYIQLLEPHLDAEAARNLQHGLDERLGCTSPRHGRSGVIMAADIEVNVVRVAALLEYGVERVVLKDFLCAAQCEPLRYADGGDVPGR